MKMIRFLTRRRRSPGRLSASILLAFLAGMLYLPSPLAATYTWTTLAGGNGSGYTDGPGTSATFTAPRSVAVDVNGNVYVAQSQSIRKITPAGVVSTFAGPGLGLFNPWGVAVGADGFIYATGPLDHLLYKFSPSGALVRALNVGFPGRGLVVDAAGVSYVTSAAMIGVPPMIRRVSADGLDIDTFAGRFNEFFSLNGVAMDSAGKLYATDRSMIRMINSSGAIFTVAGQESSFGVTDGPLGVNLLRSPNGVATDQSDNLYIADGANHRIRLATRQSESTYVVSTIGGSSIGMADGAGSAAQFNDPSGIALDAAGNVYVADFGNNRIVIGTTVLPPVLSSISPVTAVAGRSESVQITAYGSRFLGGAEILWNGIPLQTAFVTEGQLRATIPAANLVVGHFPISARNPGSTPSSAEIFRVNDSRPVAYPQNVGAVVGRSSSIRLAGTLPGDPGASLVYSITRFPTRGSLTGTGASRTYLANSSGTDSFEFRVSANGLDSTPATVTINIVAGGGGFFSQYRVDAGDTASVSFPPTEENIGVTATFTKDSSGPPADLSVQTYSQNPTETSIGGEGTQFIDMRVLGGNTGDSLTAHFTLSEWIAPSTGGAGAGGVVLWYDETGNVMLDDDGTPIRRNDGLGTWRRALGRPPNSFQPPGTILVPATGGEITTSFDDSTSPKICSCLENELGGTVFAIASIAPPLPGSHKWGTVQNKSISVPSIKLLGGASSSTAGPLSVSGIAAVSSSGGTVSLVGGMITYIPPADFAGSDSFTYTLSDDLASGPATVQVEVRSSNGQSQNQLGVTVTGSCVTVEFLGIPGVQYHVQWAPSTTGPWTDVLPAITANSTGLIAYEDCDVAVARFYRTKLAE